MVPGFVLVVTLHVLPFHRSASVSSTPCETWSPTARQSLAETHDTP
jgi:hypothetical protein